MQLDENVCSFASFMCYVLVGGALVVEQVDEV